MRILPLSDLHFEIHPDNGKSFVESLRSDYDVVVIAGDLTTHKHGIENALRLFCNKYKNVVYVPGNHEYWGSDRGRVNVSISKARARLPNLHVLENDITVIDGQRFLGHTMWFPQTKESVILTGTGWSDFIKINGLRNWVYKENQAACNFFKKEIKPGDIVISHHLPSNKSVHPMYNGDAYNCFYVCSMDDVIEDTKPALWFHGHTHESCDYKLYDTRVICNPYGYEPHGEFSGMLNSKFDRNYLVVI